MKVVRLFIAFLIAVIISVALLSFFMPVSQKVEKSITINAPASVIFEQLVKLENFNRWSLWNREDYTVKHNITDADGKPGTYTLWTGHPEISGTGKMEIMDVELNKKVAHTINFISPRKNKAESVLLLNETNPSITTLNWKFAMATPRPWNIFNLFIIWKKKRGKSLRMGCYY